jgi:hypothetical protein
MGSGAVRSIELTIGTKPAAYSYEVVLGAVSNGADPGHPFLYLRACVMRVGARLVTRERNVKALRIATVAKWVTEHGSSSGGRERAA